MSPGKTYLGGFVTLGSVVLAFFTLVGLALGDCATEECVLNDHNRPLWALGVVVGTLLANAAMWFLLARSEKNDG